MLESKGLNRGSGLSVWLASQLIVLCLPLPTSINCLEPAVLDGFSPAPPRQVAYLWHSSPTLGLWPYNLSPVSGEQSVIVILAKFPGLENRGTTTRIREIVFTEMNSYLSEASYGSVHLFGNVTPSWLRLNKTKEYYGSGNFTQEKHREMIEDCFTAVGFPGLSGYSHAIIVHTGDDEASTKRSDDIWSFSYVGSVEFGTPRGIATISVSCVAESDPLGVWLHELGHQFGLPELYDTTGALDFVGPWGLMGEGSWNDGGNSPAEPMAWTRIKLGWLPESNVRVVSPGEMLTSWIQGIEVKSSQIQALKIVLSSEKYYLVESRVRIGYDSALPESGVIISYVDETKESGRGIVIVQDAEPATPNLHDAAHEPGQLFVDLDNGVKVTVISTSDTGYQVKVEYRVADLVVANITLSPPEPRVGSTIVFSIEIVNQGTANAEDFIISSSVDDDLLLWETNSLEPGSSKLVTISWNATQGSHVIKTQVDPADIIKEINEENNVLIKRFKAGYLLLVQAPFSNISVTLDNEQHYTDSNGMAKIVTEPGTRSLTIQFIVPGEEGSRSVFEHWNDSQTSNARVLSIAADMTLTATFKQQYQLGVESLFGNVTGAGWFDVGQAANLSVVSPLNLGNGTRRVFSGWTGDIDSQSQTVQVLMDSFKKVKVNWKTQQKVRLKLTDHDGNEVAIAPDKVVLSLRTGGYESLSRQTTTFLEPGSWSVQQVIWESVDVTPVPALSFELGSPTMWTIPCRIFIIEVEALDILGRPLPGASILISLANGSRVEGQTDQTGKFMVSMIPQGEFRSSVSFWGQTQHISGYLDSDTRVNLTFILCPATLLIIVAAATAVAIALLLKWRPRDSRVHPP